MAKVSMKSQENIPGPFFVDQQCISCGACWRAQPDFFKSHEVHTYAYLHRQPSTKSEFEACDEVLKICPVEAIGIDSTYELEPKPL